MLLRNAFAFAVVCVLCPSLAFADSSSDPAAPDLNQATEQVATASETPAKAEAASASPKLEITPALVNSQPNDLWERIRNGFALQEMDSPLVHNQENWYANRPEYLKRTVERSKRYLFHIVEEVEKRGMPTEIALLPFIESAYNPKAMSPAKASGIWQFIPSTGKNYGLEQNWWYDGRRDIMAATDAALDYLQKLHDQFGSWELALAAYNYGENGVERAIARNQANGEPTDYLSLRLPAETRHYVPKLIAVRNIISNPTAFGIALTEIPNKPYFTSVTLNQHIDLKLAARFAEIPLDEFVALNPAYNRPVVSATSPRTLLLPVDKVDEFNANLDSYSRPLVSWQSYAAQKGEKIDAIAKKFGTTSAWLKSNNHLVLKRNKLKASQILLVPLRSGEKVAASTVVEQDTRSDVTADNDGETPSSSTHKVRRGDTVFSIAKRYGMTVQQLKKLNGLRSNHLVLGRKLNVTEKVADKRAGAKRIAKSDDAPSVRRTTYTVRRGDTLSSIARRFKVAANDIQRWNNLSGRHSLTRGAKVTLYLAKKG